MMTEFAPPSGADERRFSISTTYVDGASEEVIRFARNALTGLERVSLTEQAIRLFEAVRDGLLYDPYSFSSTASDYRASVVAGMESAFCVPKAILLAACLRAVGIPAAVGFADVRNHLNTPKLAALMDTDLFIWHGYVQLWLEGRPFKVTPAFDSKLCARFGVRPMIFDGRSDALFHEFDVSGRRHMEYVNDRGLFVDPPINDILDEFNRTYPKLAAFSRARTESAGESGYDIDFAEGRTSGPRFPAGGNSAERSGEK